MQSAARIHVFRLKPHEDLRQSLLTFARTNSIRAAIVVTTVGSLEQANLRFANQSQGQKIKGPFEIVSLTGTLSATGCHLHIALSDHTGKTIGGHLLDESLVFTTAEIAVAELPDLTFSREHDDLSGFLELVIRPR